MSSSSTIAIMSSEEASAGDDTQITRCASCGIAAGGHIKLKECDDCDLVRYCSDECQEDHHSQHNDECQKRARELLDQRLFKQPPASNCEGDCPICFLPLPIDRNQSDMNSCCGKVICNGCSLAADERGLGENCPFCRKGIPSNEHEFEKNLKKRIKANDPAAITQWGIQCYMKGNYRQALNYFNKAAELDDLEAHFNLADMYANGFGVVERDEKKRVHHLEIAAIGGHASARFNLGIFERDNGALERGLQHFLIACTYGHDKALGEVRTGFMNKLVTKDEFAAALRAHHTAVNATKSEQREKAAMIAQILGPGQMYNVMYE